MLQSCKLDAGKLMICIVPMIDFNSAASSESPPVVQFFVTLPRANDRVIVICNPVGNNVLK